MNKQNKRVIILGAGPAGLTAAYQLGKADIPATIIERETNVGGLAKTVNFNGYLFDIGGHRFFTKVEAVECLWREVLSNGEFKRRKRLSRIYYNKNFFPYPLKLTPSLLKVGVLNSLLIPLSYLKARIKPQKSEVNFEQWVSNRFGRRLYEIFFKTYTEKVWGIPCEEISADWAAQRIRGLTLGTALQSIFKPQTAVSKNGVIKTLIEEFDYPERGPGAMWERMCELVEQQGASILLESNVEKIEWNKNAITAIEIKRRGVRERITGTDFISTLAVRDFIKMLSPAAPDSVLAAAEKLNYRDFITVALIVNRPNIFPDNWLYIHDPDVKLGRIQNFKNWSAKMVPDADKTCLGLEYFCFEGDGLWQMSEEELITLGKRELAAIGLAQPDEIVSGKVIKVPKAYPVYDANYKTALGVIRDFIESLGNIQFVGRNGMHKYNNQDHSMLTAMLAVENLLGEQHDLWAVNTDEDYLEEITTATPNQYANLISETQPKIPARLDVNNIAPVNQED